MRALLVATVALATSAYAGDQREFRCKHCGLTGKYIHGAQMMVDQFVAYCPNDHFVQISWDWHTRPPKPVRFEYGESIYVCPICKQPIARHWDEKECPRCGSTNIRIRPTGLMVD
jgi:Zn finger protein HypA/HybF involved in hydrogenase expression